MSKLAKVQKARKIIARSHRTGSDKKKSDGVPTFGHTLVQGGVMAGSAILTKYFGAVGPVPIDTAVLGAGLGGMMLLKGKNRKLAQDIVTGAALAHVARAIYGEKDFEIWVKAKKEELSGNVSELFTAEEIEARKSGQTRKGDNARVVDVKAA
jgi:hypothetical protein